MEMSIFLSLAFTEILHLVTIFYILKLNNVLFEQLHLLEPSMWQYLFLINYKEFQAPQSCSSPQPLCQDSVVCHVFPHLVSIFGLFPVLVRCDYQLIRVQVCSCDYL